MITVNQEGPEIPGEICRLSGCLFFMGLETMSRDVLNESDGDRAESKEGESMEASLELYTVTDSNCGCCLTADEQGGNYTCADRSKIFTFREQEVLARVRASSDRARSLRHEIERLEAHPEKREDMERVLGELAGLRRERVALEEERLDAAEERMRQLGHA
jgi:hypothetical protein